MKVWIWLVGRLELEPTLQKSQVRASGKHLISVPQAPVVTVLYGALAGPGPLRLFIYDVTLASVHSPPNFLCPQPGLSIRFRTEEEAPTSNSKLVTVLPTACRPLGISP